MNFEIAFGILVVFIMVSLVILFCGLLIKLYVHKVKKYTQLIYQKDVDFQKTLNTTIIETQEQVLKNISQDLHDDAGQQLTFINFQVEHLKLDNPQMGESLESISQSLSNLSSSIRDISHALNNQLFLRHDLVQAIASELNRIGKVKALQVDFTCREIRKKEFTIQEQIVIYRLFQEMMNNILKHAKATHIEVLITIDPLFVMVVKDNGKGFDLGAPLKNSLGLGNMTERANLIEYKLEIFSLVNQGTTVTLAEINNN